MADRRNVRVTPQNKAAKQKLFLELVAQGNSIEASCKGAEISSRVQRKWRTEDEDFAVRFAEAIDASTDRLRDMLKDRVEEGIMDKTDRMAPILAMFLLKQRDPSYRDNAKIEHVAGKGLAAALKKFAELGATD